jgi:hypothetical protein
MQQVAIYQHEKPAMDAVNNDHYFQIFKRDANFRIILEHVTPELGLQYINSIKTLMSADPTLTHLAWDKYMENDMYGNPFKIDYSQQLKDIQNISNYSVSPSTLRYICFGLQIYNYIKHLGKKEITIIEVGGGYGGQCKILQDICAQFNISIKKYTLIDLESLSKLQRKYLDKLNVKNVVTLSNKECLNKLEDTYDLFISNYALGEFTLDVQNFYINNVLNKCTNYFITWNSPPINSKLKFLAKKEEVPQTGHAQFPNVILTN